MDRGKEGGSWGTQLLQRRAIQLRVVSIFRKLGEIQLLLWQTDLAFVSLREGESRLVADSLTKVDKRAIRLGCCSSVFNTSLRPSLSSSSIMSWGITAERSLILIDRPNNRFPKCVDGHNSLSFSPLHSLTIDGKCLRLTWLLGREVGAKRV